MKKIKRTAALLICIIMCLTMLLGFSGCNEVSNLGDNGVFFAEGNVVVGNYAGIGVGWGAYEDTEKLRKDYWEHTVELVDKLAPTLVRTMISYEWVLTDFDNKGNTDIADDTWGYNFDNKWMNSAYQVLDYCQANDVQVAFGAWNVVGQPDTDEWGMIKNTSADPRWAEISADVMDYLVNTRGYTCIKWFVSINEPNYTGMVGESKNAYNTYEKWAQGIQNVRKAFDKIGLEAVDIIGGDTTGFSGSQEYLTGIAKDMTDIVHNYGVHLYMGNQDVDTGNMYKRMVELGKQIKELDNKFTNEHPLIIWEAGMVDGKDAADCQRLITTYNYAVRMADYTIQSALAGSAGVCYWDLDDGMYFMYNADGTTPKEWGMFSTLATASSYMQETRPWYHSSTLIGNLLRPGSTVYGATVDAESEDFRALAAVSADGTKGGILAVNRGMKAVTKSFSLEKEIQGADKIYVYIFNEKSLRLDADGYVIPNLVTDGSLSEKITLEIPANSMVAISTYPLIGGAY